MPSLAGLGWNEGSEEIGSPVGKDREMVEACLDHGAVRLALPDRASPDKSREAGLKDPMPDERRRVCRKGRVRTRR